MTLLFLVVQNDASFLLLVRCERQQDKYGKGHVESGQQCDRIQEDKAQEFRIDSCVGVEGIV